MWRPLDVLLTARTHATRGIHYPRYRIVNPRLSETTAEHQPERVRDGGRAIAEQQLAQRASQGWSS